MKAVARSAPTNEQIGRRAEILLRLHEGRLSSVTGILANGPVSHLTYNEPSILKCLAYSVREKSRMVLRYHDLTTVDIVRMVAKF